MDFSYNFSSISDVPSEHTEKYMMEIYNKDLYGRTSAEESTVLRIDTQTNNISKYLYVPSKPPLS